MYRFFVAIALFVTSFSAFAGHNPENEGKKETFNAGEVILHHVMDNHEIHIGTLSIPLPIILYSSERGLDLFSSSRLSHGDVYNGYIMEHEKIYFVGDNGEVARDEHGHITASKPFDFSITKTVVGLFLTIGLMLFFFIKTANGYKNRVGKAPKGIQAVFEPLIIFVRDDIAKPSIGKNYEKFLPYLLTIFFFIWIGNMLGLIPFIGGFNVTGNISVALVLALLTFIITIKNGNKDYWKHIYNTPGVPWWLKFPIPLMFFIELIGFISKPVVLTLRLFANITAGHIIILSFVSLIFIFNNLYGAGAGIGVSILSIAFSIFMFAIELLVAVLQAYVFTLLSALYFGSAVEEHDHAH
ncbi:MAG: ATP synthase F0 subunit A [Bacteroidetes bacterium]|nr:MAG: ATP synthase F0 subunit A [Bacteroidota bacterium]